MVGFIKSAYAIITWNPYFKHLFIFCDFSSFSLVSRFMKDFFPDHKSDPDIVDIFVALKLGRIRFVFLMKFLNDFLRFLEPFSAAKEMVVEKANDAFEGATKSVIDAYVSCTR